MIESKLFDICGWPVTITARHSQSQPTSTEPGTASFEILKIETDDDVTAYDQVHIDVAVFGSEFERIREKFLTNPLL